MNSILIKLVLVFSSILFVSSFPNVNINKDGLEGGYDKLWKQVETFEKNNLPQSALKLVETIYNSALSENNDKQIIKSTIYRLKYVKALEEDGYELAIQKLESEIKTSKIATKHILNLLLAVMYKDYYDNNMYYINQRSVTANYENTDIKTWDKTKFQDKVIKNTFLALDESFKGIDITEYSEFITYAKESKNLYPTLYDFIAYYITEDILQNKNDYYYWGQQTNDNLTDINFLNDVENFVNINVIADSLSYKNTSVKVFQNWLKIRMEDSNNLEALVNLDLKRLEYVKTNLAVNGKNNTWLATVKKLRDKYSDKPEIVMINYELASYYNTLGDEYDFRDISKINYKLYKTLAINFLDDALNYYPKSNYAPQCENLRNDIKATSFSFDVEKITAIGDKIPLKITFKNTDSLYISIHKCEYSDFINLKNQTYDEGYIKELKKITKPVIDSKKIKLPKIEDYNEHYTEYLCDGLQSGFYIIFLHAKPELSLEKNYIANSGIFISDLAFTASSFYGDYGYYVFNRQTGFPVVNAKVEVFRYEYDYKKRDNIYIKEADYNTDKNGFVKIGSDNKNRYNNIRIDISDGKSFISENTYFYSQLESNVYKYNSIKFYTDRAIYRPGQIVSFKGICLESEGNDYKIIPNYTAKVNLYDVNNQVLSSLDLKANEFGSINGSFTIPLGVLTGYFRIATDNSSINIKVEEYKRPMFEVNMLPIEGEYRINDSVFAEGEAKTYAGTALTDAKVSFTIVRNSLFGAFYSFMNYGSEEIYFGDSKLDENGKFKINFKAIANTSESLSEHIFYSYTINVSVTDINGETQTTSSSVNVSNRALSISENIGDVVMQSNIDSISISTINVSGIFVPANVEIEIFKLKDEKQLLTKKAWDIVDINMYSKEEWYKQYPGHEYINETEFVSWINEKSVFKKTINTANTKKIKLDGIEKWSSGVYRVVMSSSDKWDNRIKYSKEFTIFAKNDKNTPYVTTSFFSADKNSAQPGDIVNIFLGSSLKNINVIYHLEVNGKVQKTEFIKLNSELKKIEIPIEEAHRGGITANFMFIKNGRLYSFKHNISVAWKNKELDIKFITFRDKTLPGASENWKLKISDNLSNAVNAEFMASLYDASLDVFAKNSWSLSLNPFYSSSINWQTYSFVYNSSYQDSRNFLKKHINTIIYTPQLNLFGLNERWYYMRNKEISFAGSDDVILKNSEPVAYAPSVARENSLDKPSEQIQENSNSSFEMGGGTIVNAEQSKQDIQIRKNFNETAFFYPNIVTNENGEIFLSFTMPESLTRWNFMGMAYTKDLKVGYINENVITQKELMVMPNLPRFFRENDKMKVSTKINNVSEITISGTAKVEFFNPETSKPVNDIFLGKSSNSLSFSVESKKNTSVEWEILIPENMSAVGIRIIADGQNHSDGEERIIPILTNRMLVTESMPLPVRKSGTTKFFIERLKNSGTSNTLRHNSYTLEFTSNPAWYAVQALPYLMEYPYECAEQTFSRFYANSLATHIANSDPKIKRVFEIWKNTPESGSLLSNLEKNQELKSLLVEETPWLLDAKNENERKLKLGILFDINRMNMENNSALKKLSEMQTFNGGWPWFKGMPESWYITQHIACGFGHLNKLGVTSIKENNTVWDMATKAISFIDGELEESYKNLKKNCDSKCMEKDNLSYMHIHYLYVRSFFKNDIPMNESTKEAFNYYLNQASKYWQDKGFYMHGMISIALNRYGDKTTAMKIISSLKEYAINNKEVGMYWKVNSGFYWYQAPIETQTILIEAFDEVANDSKSVDEMKVWLLKQKQTQDWKTTKATAEAIYVLLLKGSNLLAETDYPVIKIGGMTIDASNDTEISSDAGTGYFKKSWDASQIKPEWSDISVTKKSNSVAWGAIYWQYFEQLDKITLFEETPLKINKNLFVERRDSGKPVIIPIENDAQLKVGDKIKVRIEISVDRDMEYVHLKDMRASCFEPVDYSSGYRYKSGLGYYQGIKDASMNFFIDYLRKGTYVFEYDLITSQKGNFSNGITTMQCMYAPEFTTHSEGIRVEVGE